MASVSHRYSIRWLPDEASEPTSTLVLTLDSGFYIDIRIKHGSTDQPPSCLPIKDDSLLSSYANAETKDSMHDMHLDWGFAGQSVSSGQPRHCTWEHYVDSTQSLFANRPLSDSGTMYPQPDGKTLEKGNMTNPSTGKETDYEEIWEDLPLAFPKNMSYKYYALTHDDSGVTGDCKWRRRGVFLQLGPWFQVVFRCDSFDGRKIINNGAFRMEAGFSFARWKWDEEKKVWESIVKSGTDLHGIAGPEEVEHELKHFDVVPGSSLYIGGRMWTCKELIKSDK
jgi:hypothetical protein